MNRRTISIMGIVVVLAVAWVAFGQADSGQRRGFGQMRETQTKAIAAIQEHAAKLKAMMEASAKAMEGRSFQDFTEEDRTRMREQREEQQKIIAGMEQELAKLKGFRQLRTEYEESTTPLKEILASAQNEQAKATAGKVEQLIAQHEKRFEAQMKAMGFDPTRMPRGPRQQ